MQDFRSAASSINRYTNWEEKVQEKIVLLQAEYTVLVNTLLELFEDSIPTGWAGWESIDIHRRLRLNLGDAFGTFLYIVKVMLDDMHELATFTQLDNNEDVGLSIHTRHTHNPHAIPGKAQDLLAPLVQQTQIGLAIMLTALKSEGPCHVGEHRLS
jgi:hypothetical protein